MLKSRPDRSSPIASALPSFMVLFSICAVVYAGLWSLDFEPVSGEWPWDLWVAPAAVDALTNFGELAVGIFSVAITVVAIIVELAANRYTPRITDMFVRDPVNVAAMSYFMITAVLVLWVEMSLFGPHYPHTMAIAITCAMTFGFIALLPYFAYVFDFLTPTRVVQRIRMRGVTGASRLGRGSTTLPRAREAMMTTIEQLGDIALNSVDKKDKAIAMAAVTALAEVARDYLPLKSTLPDDWYDSEILVQTDQDFIALHPDMVRALSSRRTWVEMKILRQYQAVFGEALNEMRDVNHLVAIQTRRIAMTAVEQHDNHALDLTIRFMNTYMRSTLNARDVRSAYNFFNEYRVLAEQLLDAGEGARVTQLAEHFKFYGQLAFSMNLAFILETAAYDLCGLLELVHQRQDPCHDQVLDIFLEVDREPEGNKVQEESLRGVRKAQIKLATHYLAHQAPEHARRIWDDMRGEKPGRLASIRKELEAVTEPEYWEVSDRGINFEYLPPARRATLNTFFGWFDAPHA